MGGQGKPLTETEKDRIIELARKATDSSAIAQRMGVSYETVRRVIISHQPKAPDNGPSSQE